MFFDSIDVCVCACVCVCVHVSVRACSQVSAHLLFIRSSCLCLGQVRSKLELQVQFLSPKFHHYHLYRLISFVSTWSWTQDDVTWGTCLVSTLLS